MITKRVEAHTRALRILADLDKYPQWAVKGAHAQLAAWLDYEKITDEDGYPLPDAKAQEVAGVLNIFTDYLAVVGGIK